MLINLILGYGYPFNENKAKDGLLEKHRYLLFTTTILSLLSLTFYPKQITWLVSIMSAVFGKRLSLDKDLLLIMIDLWILPMYLLETKTL